MKNTPTATIEDYLGIIFTLERDGEKVIGARLAEILHVAPPTVTATLKRMVRDGWVEIDKKKQIRLTKTGSEAAQSVIRQHMLTEWLLSRVLKIPWKDLHDEAHKIEHSISKDVENRLAAIMDEPDVCPHGNPMPGQEDISRNWIPITEFAPGEIFTLRRIHELIEEDNQSLQFLDENNLFPGSVIEFITLDEKSETLHIKLKSKKIEIPLQIACKLFAEKTE